MSENFTRAAHLLSLTYSGNSEQIRQAEEELKIISQDTQGYSSFLLTLITAMESPQLLRSAAATRFRHFMRESISAGKITAELKSLMVEMIYQGLISPYIDKTTRGVLNFSLNPLLAEDGMGVCASRLASLAINGLNGEGSQIQGSLLVIKSIFSSMTPQFQTGEYSRILVPHLVEVGKKGLYLINSGIQTSNESLGMEGMNVLEDWTATLRQILEHFEVASSKGTKEFLEYSEIAIIFTSIMNFVLPDYRLGNVVINITDTQMNKTLNCIKVNVLKSLNILITFVIEFKKKLLEEQGAYPKVMTLVGSELPHSPFVNLCSSILEPLITAVISISHQPDINDLMTFDYVSDILIEAMKLFHKCCTETLFYGVFAQYHKSLIVDVCFNFIRVLDKDRELFEEHPEEFVSSTQDVCERQESETIKTCAAQVLESLCESVDGALAFVTYFVYQVCDMILSGKSSDAIMEYNVIKDHADSKFINLDEEIKLEASFMILSVLSFVISSRKDLTEVIESLLSTYIGRLFSVTSGIVQNRVCLFLYFYAENIFTEKSEHFKSCMHFVMNCVSPGHSRAVIIQASETFGNIMQDQEIMFRLEPFIDEIIDKAVQAIPNQTEKSFFEALVELVQNFSESIAEKIVPLIIGVVQKIEIEAQIIVTSGKKESIIMIKL